MSERTDRPNPRKRRKLQFNLRLILVLFVVAALAAAWLSREIRLASNERQAIESFGADIIVGFDYQTDETGNVDRQLEPPTPAFIRRLMGENIFCRVRHADVGRLWDSENALSPDYFERLSAFESVEILELRRNKTAESLEQMPEFQKLRNLSVFEFVMLENLDGIGVLHPLEKLKVADCRRLSSVDGLVELPSLKELFLTGCIGLETLPPLRNMNSLKDVTIVICPITDLSFADGMDCLETLTISRCNSLEDVSALGSAGSLRSVELRSCRQLTTLSGMGDCQLEELEIAFCRELANIDGIRGMTSLRRLELNNCHDLINLDALGSLTGLQVLRGAGLGSAVAPSEILRGLTALEELYLTDCHHLGNLDSLSEMKDLRILRLNGCERLINIDGIEGHSELHRLEISDAMLVNLDVLSSLRNLEYLHVGILGLSEANVTVLGQLTNLQELVIRCPTKPDKTLADKLRELLPPPTNIGLYYDE